MSINFDLLSIKSTQISTFCRFKFWLSVDQVDSNFEFFVDQVDSNFDLLSINFDLNFDLLSIKSNQISNFCRSNFNFCRSSRLKFRIFCRSSRLKFQPFADSNFDLLSINFDSNSPHSYAYKHHGYFDQYRNKSFYYQPLSDVLPAVHP